MPKAHHSVFGSGCEGIDKKKKEEEAGASMLEVLHELEAPAYGDGAGYWNKRSGSSICLMMPNVYSFGHVDG